MQFTGEHFTPEMHGNIELERIHRYLLACEIASGKIVLDIASGEGYGSAMLAKNAIKVIGVDISRDAIYHARKKYKRNNLEYLIGECAGIPLDDSSVDLVVCFETIEHHDQHDDMMQEIKRVLRPDGSALISSPDKYRYSIETAYNNPYHVKELYDYQFKNLIKKYFVNSLFFGQRVVYGSSIFSDSLSTPIKSYSQNGDNIESSSGITKPIYWLALASDVDQPSVASGFFEQPIENSEIFHTWNGVVAERNAQIDNLTRAVTEQDAQNGNLTRAVTNRDNQIAKLKCCETELAILRATKLIRLRDAIAIGPWRLRKIARIAYLLIAFTTPRCVKRIILPIIKKIPGNPIKAKQLSSEPVFDKALYLHLNPDIAAAGIDPYEHYVRHGKAEGRIGYKPNVEIRGSLDLLDASRETVLVVSHEGSRTGAPVLGYNLVREFLKRYNVVALFLGAGGPVMEECLAAGAVVAGPIPFQWRGLLSELVAKEIADQFSIKFAIVNSIESRYVLPALAHCYIPSVTLIHEFAAYTRPHGVFLEAVYWSGQTVFSARITRDNARSEYMELAEREFPVIPQGRCVVPERVNDQKMLVEAEVIRRTMRPAGFPSDGVVILGAGSVQLRKGIDLFLECASRVCRNAPDLSCRFVWIGKGYDPDMDGAYSVYLADQISRADLEGHVYFLNEVSDLAAAYTLADLFLLTSRLDPLPNVAIDALTEGLPMVCFDKTTGIADILNEQGLGEACVATYLDTECMSRKVIALARSKELRERIGAKSAQIATSIFDMESYVAQLEDLATQEIEHTQQELKDVQTIVKSDLIRLDYFLSPDMQHVTRDDAVRRYVRSWASGLKQRKMFPGFHPGVYLEQHGVKKTGTDPLADFLREGQPQGPWNSELITPDERPMHVASDLRVGVHIHACYPGLFSQIMERIKQNRIRPDLLISVTNEEAYNAIVTQTKAYKGGEVDIRVVPDRGRDIGPFLTEFGEKIRKNYDLIGHFHTMKSSDLYDDFNSQAWYSFLQENLLGGKVPMADIILGRMSENRNVGMVFPDDPYAIRLGMNRHCVEEIGSQIGLDSVPENVVFPAGNMFWSKVSFLDTIFNLGLKWESYPKEPLPKNGSLLQAIERLLPLVVLKAGGDLLLSNVEGVTR
jgi:glycosyltransferase involved in cell wall biosynthesis/ubiquinone/menaquinone biosynthesis C-methylase UbiE